ncbi:MAG: AAA family ATPase [Patescibacteria group bacterium]
MNDIKTKKILKGLYEVLTLEDLFPHRVRRVVFQMFGSASLVLIIVLIFGGEAADKNIKGGAFLCISITLFLFTLEAYFYSTVIQSREKFFVSFDIGELLYYVDDNDLTCALLFSNIGDLGMKRLGYSEDEIREFLVARNKVPFTGVFDSVTDHMYAEDYFKLIYENDNNLRDFLFKKGVSEDEFIGAMLWVVKKNRKVIEKERFWSKDNLSRIGGIGKNWSYGETFTLDRYGTDLTESAKDFEPVYIKSKEKVITRLESVLVRGNGSNAIIVSDDGESRQDVVVMLAGLISAGKSLVHLQHKRVFLINPNLIIESQGDKISFEREFSVMLGEADRAENVILVIPELTSFIKSATTIGADVISLIAPFIHSPNIHIVGLDSKKNYYDFLGNKNILTENFEMIATDNGDDSSLISMLVEEVEEIEKVGKVTVTYPALLCVVESAKKYFEESLKAIKSKELLLESVGLVLGQGRRTVIKSDVLSLVEAETGVPTTAPTGKEKEILLHLTDLLKARIVGQDEACEVIGDALKRGRAGVRNPNKPIGSFLFLGPTGVGKTETVKALADTMFEGENNISRFDMSEFRDYSATERLIGSFNTDQLGVLSLALRQKPYGVMLLDEFEKTTPEVLNLFLRIFDEGMFTDAHNSKINARNNVIIATSNAGSEIIWDIIRNGGDLEKEKNRVIDTIIAGGIFKPELLNRFDAVVLFHPLKPADLEKIAKLMMDKFTKRMKERGIIVHATPEFLSYLVSKGNDPKFGARPMNRAIDDDVEKYVADRLIRGEIAQGDKITFEINNEGLFHLRKG